MKGTFVLARVVIATCVAGFVWFIATRSPNSGLSAGARIIGDGLFTLWCTALGVLLFRCRLRTGEFQYLSVIMLCSPLTFIGGVLSSPYESSVIWWSALSIMAMLAAFAHRR